MNVSGPVDKNLSRVEKWAARGNAWRWWAALAWLYFVLAVLLCVIGGGFAFIASAVGLDALSSGISFAAGILIMERVMRKDGS